MTMLVVTHEMGVRDRRRPPGHLHGRGRDHRAERAGRVLQQSPARAGRSSSSARSSATERATGSACEFREKWGSERNFPIPRNSHADPVFRIVPRGASGRILPVPFGGVPKRSQRHRLEIGWGHHDPRGFESHPLRQMASDPRLHVWTLSFRHARSRFAPGALPGVRWRRRSCGEEGGDVPKNGTDHRLSLRDGREVFLDGAPRRRRHRSPRLSQRGRDRLLALRLPGGAGEPRAHDLRVADERRPRQPVLAAPRQLPGPRRAPGGDRRVGGDLRRLARTIPGPRRVLHGGAGDGGAPLSRPRRGAREGASRLLRVGARQRPLPHLRHHQPAGRPFEADRRPGRGVPRLRRGGRGLHRDHGARREDAGHGIDHGQRGARREHPAPASRGRRSTRSPSRSRWATRGSR